MPRLPEIVLDDRQFQDLVNEARVRVARHCPEWTDHNVSDPGITLIELFAWLTETLVYRVNRIPAKLHVALLELLGMRLRPPTAATHRHPLPARGPAGGEDVVIPGGETEVATQRLGPEEPVVFQTEQDFTIPVARPTAYAVERDGKPKDVGVVRGVASPKGPDQLPFASPPKVGDALYLAFDQPLGRLLMQVDVDCSQAKGAGVDPEDPPLRWEVSAGDGQWAEAEVLEDRTGGFNYGSGVVELQLPDSSAPMTFAGSRGPLAALSSRFRAALGRRGDQGQPVHAPARDLLDHRGADRGADPGVRRRAGDRRVARRERRHARPVVRAPELADARADPGRDARGAQPRVRRLGGVGPRGVVRGERPRRPPLHARPGQRRRRARPGDPGGRRLVAAVRRGAGEGGRRCASRATGTGAAGAETCCRAR